MNIYSNPLNSKITRADPPLRSEQIYPSNFSSFNTPDPTTIGSDLRLQNSRSLSKTVPQTVWQTVPQTVPQTVQPNHYYLIPHSQQNYHSGHGLTPIQIQRENFAKTSQSIPPPPNPQLFTYLSDSSEVRSQPTPSYSTEPAPNYSSYSLKQPVTQGAERAPAGASLELEKKECVTCTELTKLVEKLEKRVQELSYQVEKPISTDGTFTWRISDVSKQPAGSIESPVFYTSRLGYKLQGCVYLKGDREATGKCVSAYITLLKGDYDSLLDWPFQFPVSIYLIDQSLKGKDFVQTFQPTRTSSCFRQPFDHIKRPTGFPEFMPLADLKDPFLVDDTLYIKFLVHIPPV